MKKILLMLFVVLTLLLIACSNSLEDGDICTIRFSLLRDSSRTAYPYDDIFNNTDSILLKYKLAEEEEFNEDCIYSWKNFQDFSNFELHLKFDVYDFYIVIENNGRRRISNISNYIIDKSFLNLEFTLDKEEFLMNSEGGFEYKINLYNSDIVKSAVGILKLHDDDNPIMSVDIPIVTEQYDSVPSVLYREKSIPSNIYDITIVLYGDTEKHFELTRYSETFYILDNQNTSFIASNIYDDKYQRLILNIDNKDNFIYYNTDKSYTLPNPSKEGYDFLGWYYYDFMPSFSETKVTEISRNNPYKKLYARWNYKIKTSDFPTLCTKLDSDSVYYISIQDLLPDLYELRRILVNHGQKHFIIDLTNCSELKKLEKNSFKDCTNILRLLLPKSLTSIEDGAFNQSQINEVLIPDSVKYISPTSFSDAAIYKIKVDSNNKIYDSRDDCNAIIQKNSNELLVACRSLTIIPSTVTSISENAFSSSYTSHYNYIYIPDSVLELKEGTFYNCHINKIRLPDNLKQIKDNTFSGSYVSEVEIPDGVVNIGSHAFSGCSLLIDPILPKKLTTIDCGAFSGCSKLTAIRIPASVTSIGRGSFSNTALSSIVFENSDGWYETDDYTTWKNKDIAQSHIIDVTDRKKMIEKLTDMDGLIFLFKIID